MSRLGRGILGRITAFLARRLVVPLFIALVVIGALALAGSGAPPASLGEAAAAPARPNIIVIETDDQTLESMRVMDNVNSLIGDRGATFRNSFVNFSLCCPSRATFLTGQYMHNHRVFGNKYPSGGFGRFQELHGNYNLAHWVRRAGYYTAMIGKYLNEYRSDSPVATGLVGVACGPRGIRGLQLPHKRERHPGPIRLDPADFKQDVLTRKAVNFVNRRAPRAMPFFLWLTYTAPHWSPPDPNPNPPSDCRKAAKPAPRHANAFDDEPLPMPPNFNEANVSDKPGQIREPPAFGRELDQHHPAHLPLRAGIAAVGGRGGEEGRGCAEGQDRAQQDGADVHLRQRLLPRRAPDPQGQAAHLRGVDPGAAPDAGAGHPAGGDHPRTS